MTGHIVLLCALCTISLHISNCQDCSQYTRDECLLKHIDGCADPSSCTRDPNAGKSKAKKQQNPESDTESGTSFSDSSTCFHGDGLVFTDQSRMIRIADVAAGGSQSPIKVLSRDDSGRLIFSPINHWLHAEPDREQVFLVFETEHGQRLSLTKNHLIYRTNCSNSVPEAVLADRLQPGQCVLVTANENRHLIESRIGSRTSEVQRGIYAPITQPGNLVVDGVLVSCFTSLENETLQRIMYQYLDVFYRLIRSMISIASFFGNASSTNNTAHSVPEVIFSFWDLGQHFVSH